jgi:hypothetical protein
MNAISSDLYVPAGAVTAAIIAGLFSYLALVITKEQKISEFRQAWIDALREDTANFITALRLMKYTAGLVPELVQKGTPPAEIAKALSIPYETMSVCYNRILLRLHPHGPQNQLSADLIKTLTTIQTALKGNKDYAKAVESSEQVREQARLVLKAEWEIVKKGETTFVLSKWIIGGLLVVAISFLIYLIMVALTP